MFASSTFISIYALLRSRVLIALVAFATGIVVCYVSPEVQSVAERTVDTGLMVLRLVTFRSQL